MRDSRPTLCWSSVTGAREAAPVSESARSSSISFSSIGLNFAVL